MDYPICSSAKGLKDRQELVQHMEIHRNNPELMIEKIADYISGQCFKKQYTEKYKLYY
jgi:hypothetical protein